MTEPGSGPVLPATDAAAALATELPRPTLLRAGGATPLRAGDRLRVGDALHLELEPLRAPLHVWIVNEDAEGRLYVLFPLEEGDLRNPLPPGTSRLPGPIDGAAHDWVVTSAGGDESFLFVVSRDPLPRFERALADTARASRSRRVEPSGDEERLRGVGGLERADEPAGAGRLAALEQLVVTAHGGDEVRAELLTLRGQQPGGGE